MASIYSLVSFKYNVVNLSKIKINILIYTSINGMPAVHWTGNVWYKSSTIKYKFKKKMTTKKYRLMFLLFSFITNTQI